MNVFSLQPYEINEIEPCVVVKDNSNKIYIPKVMPLLKKGSTDIDTVKISLNLINAKDCEPSYSKTIKTQSFINPVTKTHPPHIHEKYRSHTYPISDPPTSIEVQPSCKIKDIATYDAGTKLLCFVVNKNLRHIVLSDYNY